MDILLLTSRSIAPTELTSNFQIHYDPQLGRWVGDGVEEEHAPAPPPIVPVATPNTSMTAGSPPAPGQTAPADTSGMMNGTAASPAAAAAPSPTANSFSLGRRSGT